MSDREAAIRAVLGVTGRLFREDRHVESWPEDEREIHRHGEWRNFDERADLVSRRIAEKVVDAVREAEANGRS